MFNTEPKYTKQKKHKDKVITWLDSFYDVHFVKLLNTQNNAVCKAKCACWMCVHIVVFLPSDNT